MEKRKSVVLIVLSVASVLGNSQMQEQQRFNKMWVKLNKI